MKIALIQQAASPDRDANVEKGLANLEKAVAQGAEVICFAELAFTPFYPQEEARGDVSHLAEPIPGPTTAAFAAAATHHGAVVVLNLFERDGESTYDSSPVINTDGSILGTTRMIHITDYPCFHEKGYYTPGDRGVPVYRTPFGRLGIAICYDRHYPEYMRVLAGGGTDEILVCDLDLAQADDSHARRLFLRDRRPDLYGDWLR